MILGLLVNLSGISFLFGKMGDNNSIYLIYDQSHTFLYRAWPLTSP
jgi:hypothetical protein